MIRRPRDAYKIVVLGYGKGRWDTPIKEIQTVSKNISIGLNLYDIAKKYRVEKDAQIPAGGKDIDLE